MSRLPVLEPPSMGGREYFDRLYGASDDPWRFDTRPEERLKYERTLELCGPGPFQSALEIGCSIGAFTELLAPRCASLIATDVSEHAVRAVRRRAVALPQVTCEVRDVRHAFPEGSFDLILVSDVLYYWAFDEIIDFLHHVEQGLAPGGTLVTLHYAPRIGTVLSGSEVHDLIAQQLRLDHVLTETTEFGPGRSYRIDRFVRPSREVIPRRQEPPPA